MVWLKRPDLVVRPDISFNFLNSFFYLLLIFKVLKQFAHIAFEFHLRFQKMREGLSRLLKSPFRRSSSFCKNN